MGCSILVVLRGTDTNLRENCLHFETVLLINFPYILNILSEVKGGDLELMLLVSVYVSSSCVMA